MSSHFCGHVETLNICRFELYKSQYRYTVTQASTEKNFKNLRKNFTSSLLAIWILEIFEKCTFHDENLDAEEIFSLLEKTLEELSLEKSTFLVIERFKLHLLQKSGALPEISACTGCHQRWETGKRMYLGDDQHLFCEKCREEFPAVYREIEFKIIKLMAFLLKKDSEHLKIILTKNEEEKLKNFTDLFLRQYINREIFSDKLIPFQLSVHFGSVEAS